MIVLCVKKRLPFDELGIYDGEHGHNTELLPIAVGMLRD